MQEEPVSIASVIFASMRASPEGAVTEATSESIALGMAKAVARLEGLLWELAQVGIDPLSASLKSSGDAFMVEVCTFGFRHGILSLPKIDGSVGKESLYEVAQRLADLRERCSRIARLAEQG